MPGTPRSVETFASGLCYVFVFPKKNGGLAQKKLVKPKQMVVFSGIQPG